MAVSDRFYTPHQDTSGDGVEVDYVEHVLPYDGHRLHVYVWAAEDPRGVFAISHGAGEHARRYQRLANTLREQGWTVVADDHLGHGRTGVNSPLGLGRLGIDGNPGARRAMREVLRWTRAHHHGLPLVLHGHSWGSLLAQQLVYAEPRLVDGLVLTGTTLALPGFINPGDYNAEWVGDGHNMSWLSRDPAEVQRMIDDRYGFDIGDAPVWSIAGALQLLSVPPILRRGRAARLPILIQCGEHDPLGYRGRGPRALTWWLRHVSRFTDVESHIYPGARHEVYNELNRDEIVGDLTRWLDWHFAL